MLEEIKRSEDLTKPIWNKVTFKDGKVHELAVANEEGTLIFRDSVLDYYIPFDENGRNNWEKSSLKKFLEKWWEDNAPEWLKEKYTVTIPEAWEVVCEEELYSEMRGKGKQWTIFKDWHNIPKSLYGKKHATWWWTKTPYPWYCSNAARCLPDGALHISIAGDSFALVPACLLK